MTLLAPANAAPGTALPEPRPPPESPRFWRPPEDEIPRIGMPPDHTDGLEAGRHPLSRVFSWSTHSALGHPRAAAPFLFQTRRVQNRKNRRSGGLLVVVVSLDAEAFFATLPRRETQAISIVTSSARISKAQILRIRGPSSPVPCSRHDYQI